MKIYENFMSNSGLKNPEWRKFVLTAIALVFMLALISSVFSYGFFHYDEHYQIIEYVGLKMGKSAPENAAWEYNARIRPWMQPGLYYVISKILTLSGVKNPFVLSFSFRFITAIFGVCAIFAAILLSYFYFPEDLKKRKSVGFIFIFLFIIPYFIVRTSSEALSSAFFMIGLSFFFLFSEKEGEKISPSFFTAFLCGIILGFSFQFRYQIAFMIVGFILWFFIFSSKNYAANFLKILSFGLGFLLVIALGVLVDFWGYGEWGLTFWNYFYRNIALKASHNWGVEPFWGYFYLVNAHPFFIVTIISTLAFIVYWIRFPLSLFSFITIIFFLGHSVVAHKEARFLFSMIYFIPFAITGVFSKNNDKFDFIYNFFISKSKLPRIIFLTLNVIFMVILIFFDARFELPIQREIQKIYKNNKENFTLYCIKDTNPYANYGISMNFYKPSNLTINFMDYDEIELILNEKRRAFFVSDGIKNPILPSENYEIKILYKKFPLFVTDSKIFKETLKRFKIEKKLKYYVLYELIKK